MTAPTPDRRRISPAYPGWLRLSLLITTLLLLGAVTVPSVHRLQWWHLAIGVAITIAFLGSWHGMHLSTAARRRIAMTRRNRRRTPPVVVSQDLPVEDPQPLRTRLTIHLRPHPHAVRTAADAATDQLPWDFVTAWLHRYGIRADELTVCTVTKTPAPSSLRTDSANLLTGRTPQHRDTWLTYTLSAANNLGALAARRARPSGAATAIEEAGIGESSPEQPAQQAGLADVTARRLIAELRERGWLATVCDEQDATPRFVPPAAVLRRECWTGAEYADGFRAVYAVHPRRIDAALAALPSAPAKEIWVAVTIQQGQRSATAKASVGLLTATRPALRPLPSLDGVHGGHRPAAEGLSVAGQAASAGVYNAPGADLSSLTLNEISWPTTAFGVPIGFTRERQPAYLGLDSPEPVRVTVTGSPEFHVGITARLALAGTPVAIFTRHPRRWTALANHGAANQIHLNPQSISAGSIVVTDDGTTPPQAAVAVMLRSPQRTAPPATTVVITQDPRRGELLMISTPHGDQWLNTRLS